jgi:hypothetical protein
MAQGYEELMCTHTSARERIANFFAETAFFSLVLDCISLECIGKRQESVLMP